MTSYEWLIAHAGELAALLHLQALDARIGQAERVQIEVVRQLNENRIRLEKLARSSESERSQLAKLAPDDRERVRLELVIRNRQHEIARLAAMLETNHRCGEPLRARARETIRASTKERGRILLHLDCALATRYQELAHRRTQPFIVFAGHGRCGGCALPLTPGLMEILQRPDAIADCPRCHRMIYGRLLDT